MYVRKKDGSSGWGVSVSGAPCYVRGNKRGLCTLGSYGSQHSGDDHLLKLLCRDGTQVTSLWVSSLRIQSNSWRNVHISVHRTVSFASPKWRCPSDSPGRSNHRGAWRWLRTLHTDGMLYRAANEPQYNWHSLSRSAGQGTSSDCVQRCCSVKMVRGIERRAANQRCLRACMSQGSYPASGTRTFTSAFMYPVIRRIVSDCLTGFAFPCLISTVLGNFFGLARFSASVLSFSLFPPTRNITNVLFSRVFQ